jgi:hypothetical protein
MKRFWIRETGALRGALLERNVLFPCALCVLCDRVGGL